MGLALTASITNNIAKIVSKSELCEKSNHLRKKNAAGMESEQHD